MSAYYDPVAGINSHSQTIELTDIFADGDYKFIAANFGLNKSDLKLKVFKGASLIKENNLVDSATAVLSFYMDNLQPRVPGKLNTKGLCGLLSLSWFWVIAIAVASGSALYIYKNLRPSFQFTLPGLEVSDVEKEIWAKAKDVSYLFK